MKFYLFVLAMCLLSLSSIAQKPVSGTYTFDYCDLEYNLCLGSCKVVIKGDSIIIYATKELAEKITHTKEGDILEQGLILKHKTGEWIIAKSRKDSETNEISYDIARLNFRKKQFWRY
jgi:hypothetical protein